MGKETSDTESYPLRRHIRSTCKPSSERDTDDWMECMWYQGTVARTQELWDSLAGKMTAALRCSADTIYEK